MHYGAGRPCMCLWDRRILLLTLLVLSGASALSFAVSSADYTVTPGAYATIDLTSCSGGYTVTIAEVQVTAAITLADVADCTVNIAYSTARYVDICVSGGGSDSVRRSSVNVHHVDFTGAGQYIRVGNMKHHASVSIQYVTLSDGTITVQDFIAATTAVEGANLLDISHNSITTSGTNAIRFAHGIAHLLAFTVVNNTVANQGSAGSCSALSSDLGAPFANIAAWTIQDNRFHVECAVTANAVALQDSVNDITTWTISGNTLNARSTANAAYAVYHVNAIVGNITALRYTSNNIYAGCATHCSGIRWMSSLIGSGEADTAGGLTISYNTIITESTSSTTA